MQQLSLYQVRIIFSPVLVNDGILVPLTVDPYTIYWGEHHARLQTQAAAEQRHLPFIFNPPLGLRLPKATIEAIWQQAVAEYQHDLPADFVTVQGKVPKVTVYLIGSNQQGFVPLQWQQFATLAEATAFARWLGAARRVPVKQKHPMMPLFKMNNGG
jgi:hypothetical protein